MKGSFRFCVMPTLLGDESVAAPPRLKCDR
jgi:hypothetical protein